MVSLSVPSYHNYLFKNWSGTVEVRAQKCFEPSSAEEMRKILSLARLNKKKVKVIGSGYSFSDMAMNEEYMIKMNRMDRILEIDTDNFTVTAEAGITMKRLNDVLFEKGLAFSVLPVVSGITLGGAISAGAHGSGSNYGSLSAYILELEMVTASGEVLMVTPEGDSELFSAAGLSIGALGIIISVKMQCEPKFNLSLVSYGIKLQDLLENLNVHVASSDHFMFSVYPYIDSAVAVHFKRTDQVIAKPKSGYLCSRLLSSMIGQLSEHIYLLFSLMSSVFPSLSPWIQRFLYRLGSKRQEVTGRSDQLFSLNLFNHVPCEWSVPREKAALVIYELNQMISERRIPVQYPIVVRFSKADDMLLSPAYRRDVCYIGIVSPRPYGLALPHEKFFHACSDLMAKNEGRIHWAKNTFLTYSDIQTMYPGLQTFLDIRQKLDPEGLFINPYLKRCLGVE